MVNQVRLTVRDVKRLGEILDQAIALGANQINHIAFDIAKPEALKDEARKQAMENAADVVNSMPRLPVDSWDPCCASRRA